MVGDPMWVLGLSWKAILPANDRERNMNLYRCCSRASSGFQTHRMSALDWRRWGAAATTLFCIFSCGCSGQYRGRILSPPVKSVVLFPIEGTDGEEFTEVLSVELAGACRGNDQNVSVVDARHVAGLDVRSGAGEASSLVRDVSAQAYIVGSITEVMLTDEGKCGCAGEFRLYSVDIEGVVGGITDAHYWIQRDPSVKLSAWQKQKIRVSLARMVARQLARGLGY